MTISDILNHTVNHKKLGAGTVTSLDEPYFFVDFPTTKPMKFKFPDAFESFLTIDDENLNRSIHDLIEECKEQRGQEKQMIPTTNTEDDSCRITVLKQGSSFGTHAEVLNDCFRRSYKSFQSAYLEIDDEYAVWFPNIARRVQDEYVSTDKSYGWMNILCDNGKTIVQLNRDPAVQEGAKRMNRLVFAKFDGKGAYSFLGVYDFGELVEGGIKGARIGTEFDTVNMKVIK